MKARPFSRRQVIAGMSGALIAPSVLRAAEPSRIISLDYGLASTAMALGVTPKAVCTAADWGKWVVEPPLPQGVADLGNTWEVNFEMVAQIRPDLILSTPFASAAKPRLENFAPVLELQVYTPEGGDVIPKAVAATRRIGEALGRRQQAEDFIARTEDFFDQCRGRIARIGARPLVLVYFMDARHVRVYTSPGLYTNVLKEIGIEDAWNGSGNYWGFETVPIESLARIINPEARMVAFEPVIPAILPKVERSPLWHALPFSRPGHLDILPGTLTFGMLSDAVRFARIMTDYVERTA